MPPIAAAFCLSSQRPIQFHPPLIYPNRCKKSIPKIAMVPPDLVTTPHGPTFLFSNVFCTAEAKTPTPPVNNVVLVAEAIASLGRKTFSSVVEDIARRAAWMGVKSGGRGELLQCGRCFWVVGGDHRPSNLLASTPPKALA